MAAQISSRAGRSDEKGKHTDAELDNPVKLKPAAVSERTMHAQQLTKIFPSSFFQPFHTATDT